MGRRRKERKQPRIAPAPNLKRIVVCCPDEQIDAIRSALSSIDMRVYHVQWHPEKIQVLLSDALALILALPLPTVHVRSAVRQFAVCGYPVNTPVFVLAPENTDQSEVWQLYSAGAASVLDWPRDVFVLPECLLEMHHAERMKIQPDEIDAVLTNTCRTHLNLFRGIAANTRLSVHSGIAHLSGEVPRLCYRNQISTMIENIPGITAVEMDELTVRKSVATDADIRKNIRKMLRYSIQKDDTALGVEVTDGKVTIKGTTKDASELRRIRQLITNVAGVKEVRNSVEVVTERWYQELRMNDILTDAIQICFPEADVTVSLFNGIAVLSGKVNTAMEKWKIEVLVLETEEVSKVVNNITVMYF